MRLLPETPDVDQDGHGHCASSKKRNSLQLPDLCRRCISMTGSSDGSRSLSCERWGIKLLNPGPTTSNQSGRGNEAGVTWARDPLNLHRNQEKSLICTRGEAGHLCASRPIHHIQCLGFRIVECVISCIRGFGQINHRRCDLFTSRLFSVYWVSIKCV